ncbi:hypothetical protein Zm00014a_002690 [Zea mays]|uniref:Uncharacterized protein n=1 Tax=Zea mays TaxID=4577 RepID=A0A3L6D780_MAIZE|nr:hypothetical protein Zm00014a_002690 [Zea mays]
MGTNLELKLGGCLCKLYFLSHLHQNLFSDNQHILTCFYVLSLTLRVF